MVVAGPSPLRSGAAARRPGLASVTAMSALTRPHGPLPARVYWVRRLLVISTALALVFGIGRLLSLGSDGSSASQGKARQAAASTSDSSSPSAQPSKKRKKKHRSQAAGGHEPTKPPLPQPTGACEPGDIVISPEIKDARAGGEVKIRLKLTTRISPACDWQLSADTLTYKITSGSDSYWSSLDCPAVLPTKDLVLRQSKPAWASVTWPATRSEPGCPRDVEWAGPGWYHVAVAAFDGEPADQQFQLKLPVTPTVTANPHPHRSPGGSGKPSGTPSGAVEPNG